MFNWKKITCYIISVIFFVAGLFAFRAGLSSPTGSAAILPLEFMGFLILALLLGGAGLLFLILAMKEKR